MLRAVVETLAFEAAIEITNDEAPLLAPAHRNLSRQRRGSVVVALPLDADTAVHLATSGTQILSRNASF